jgi:hypothetical protein
VFNKFQKPLSLFLFALAIVCPALLVIFVILRFGVDVPYWDDWAFVHLLERIQTHQLSLMDFLYQHNEHRMAFPRLLKLGLAWFSRWNVFYELFASWTLIVLSFFILLNLLRITLGEKFKDKIKLLLVLNSLLIFSLAQGENFVWGWQLQWFLANFFTFLSIWALARWKGRWMGVVAAALATFAAQYSIASGQFLWLLGFAILLIEQQWKLAQRLFWFLFAAASFGFYFYHFTDENRNLFLFLQRPFGFLLFVSGSLGSPFGTFGPVGGLYLSALYGGIALLLFISSIIFLWRRFYDLWIKLLPWIELAFYGLMSVGATAAGRMQYGIEYHALVSRYSIFALLFWIGTLVCVAVCADVLVQHGYFSRTRGRLALAFLFILLAWGHVNTSIGRYERLNEFKNRLRIAQSALYDYRRASDGDLKVTCFLDPNEVRRRAAILESLRMGPYKHGTAPEVVAQLNQAWLQEIKKRNLVESEVEPELIYIVPGDAEAAKAQQGRILKFTATKRAGVHLYLGAKTLPQNANHSLKTRVVVFQSKNASNIKVNWGDPKIHQETVSLYSIPFRNKWRLFRTQIPTDVRGYTVTLLYTDAPPIDDKLKISVYEGR